MKGRPRNTRWLIRLLRTTPSYIIAVAVFGIIVVFTEVRWLGISMEEVPLSVSLSDPGSHHGTHHYRELRRQYKSILPEFIVPTKHPHEATPVEPRWEAPLRLRLKARQEPSQSKDFVTEVGQQFLFGPRHVAVIHAHPPVPDKKGGDSRVFSLVRYISGLQYDVSYLYMYRWGQVEDRHYEELKLYTKMIWQWRDRRPFEEYKPRVVFAFVWNDPHYINWLLKAINLLKTSRIIIVTDDVQSARGLDPALERVVYEKADVIATISERVKQGVEKIVPHKEIFIVSYVPSQPVATYPGPSPYGESNHAMFVGFNNTANVKSVRFFTTNILPEIRKSIPDFEFHVFGSVDCWDCGKEPGYIWKKEIKEDLLWEALGTHLIFTAPVLEDAGVSTKIVKAMMAGLPVYTTKWGLNDISPPGKHAIVPAVVCELDDLECAKEKILNILLSEEDWSDMSVSSMHYIRERFSSSRLLNHLRNLLGQLHLFYTMRKVITITTTEMILCVTFSRLINRTQMGQIINCDVNKARLYQANHEGTIWTQDLYDLQVEMRASIYYSEESKLRMKLRSSLGVDYHTIINIRMGGVPITSDWYRSAIGWSMPLIFHSSWADRKIPRDVVKYVQTWPKFHPTATYAFWTDAALLNFVSDVYPDYLDMYNNYDTNINRADAGRYFLLHHYGGVHVDLDFECHKPFDQLLTTLPFFLGREPDVQLGAGACNAILASRPGHPFWDTVFDQLLLQQHSPHIIKATGPDLIQKAISGYPNKRGTADEVALLPADRFYPSLNNWAMENAIWFKPTNFTKNTYAEHHWIGSWYTHFYESKSRQDLFIDIKSAMSAYKNNLIVIPD